MRQRPYLREQIRRGNAVPIQIVAQHRGMAERLFSGIAPGGIVVMDDAARPGERYVARRWRQDCPDFNFTFEGGGAKGLLVGRRG